MLLCEVVHNRQCSRVTTGSECCFVRWFIIDSVVESPQALNEHCSVRWFIRDSVVGSPQALNAAL